LFVEVFHTSFKDGYFSKLAFPFAFWLRNCFKLFCLPLGSGNKSPALAFFGDFSPALGLMS